MKVLQAQFNSHLWQHLGSCSQNIEKLALGIVWASMVWVLWKQKNSIIFNNGYNLEGAVDEIKYMDWNW